MKTFEDYFNEVKKIIIDHWTKTGQSVRNMENDPVVNLLLSAFSFQAYQIHSKVERIENKTVRDFRDRSLPFHLIKPLPAFSIAETKLKEGCSEKILDENSAFEFQNSSKQKISFTPLLKTKVINAELTMAFQSEEKVWRVKLQSNEPIGNLSGVSLYLDTDKNIEIKSIRCGDFEYPLIKPNQFCELPFTKWFNNAHLLINQNYFLFGTYDYWQEIFLTQTNKLYFIDKYSQKLPHERENNLELDVTFNKPVDSNSLLKINCVPLINVEKKEISLDERNPVKALTTENCEFLNLLWEKELENDYNNVIIRQFDVERYNSFQLFEQMQEMLNRYYSDHYAFQDIRELKTSDIMVNLQNLMDDIRAVVSKLDQKMLPNYYYAILKKTNQTVKNTVVRYLLTSASAGNGIRKDEKPSKAPVSINNTKTTLLFETRGGRDSINNDAQKDDIAKYYFHTKDRLVTPADINIFIKTYYYENARLEDEIENISLINEDENIIININLKNDSYLKKAVEKTESLSELLQTKITLRSSGIKPFVVKIS